MLPACLFVFTACPFVIRLVCLGFRACRNTSTTGRAKKRPRPYVLVITTCLELYRPVGDFITDSAFSRAFSHDPTTFATNPMVVGSVTGSAPVEHLH